MRETAETTHKSVGVKSVTSQLGTHAPIDKRIPVVSVR